MNIHVVLIPGETNSKIACIYRYLQKNFKIAFVYTIQIEMYKIIKMTESKVSYVKYFFLYIFFFELLQIF